MNDCVAKTRVCNCSAAFGFIEATNGQRSPSSVVFLQQRTFNYPQLSARTDFRRNTYRFFSIILDWTRVNRPDFDFKPNAGGKNQTVPDPTNDYKIVLNTVATTGCRGRGSRKTPLITHRRELLTDGR